MREFYANGGQNQVVNRRGISLKKLAGPSNIKKRLFAVEPAKALPEN
jgi:hypothetical protein